MRVAVVGLGTVGAQAAWRLAERGADVVGFDRFAPGHDRGAAGGETRVFRTGHFEGLRYLPLVRRAERLWSELEAATGRELRSRTGCLFVGPRDEQMRTLLDSLAGVDHEVLDAFPGHRMDGGELAVLDRTGGRLRSDLAVRAAARRAADLGAALHPYVQVHGLEPARDGVRVHTAGGVERADAAVVAAGPWTAGMLPDLGRLITVKRLVNAWFEDTAGGPRPPFLRLAPVHSYGVPAPDGVTVKIGLSRPHHRDVTDPCRVDREVGLAEVELFRELVADRFPGLDPDPVRLAAYVEGYTEDGHPIVCAHPADGRIVVLAGFSGHGFKWAPAIGDIAAEAVLAGAAPVLVPPND